MVNRFRDLREDADLSQAKMAENLNMYTTTYARYERAEREVPLSFAVAFAKYFNISIDYLTGFIDTPEPLIRGIKSPKIKQEASSQKIAKAYEEAPEYIQEAICKLLHI